MAYIDYYKTLGLTKSATQADIKKTYRKLARKYHPDVNPNDKVAEKKFKEINEANEVLSNTDSRKKYDEHGKDWKHADEINKQREQAKQYGQNQGFGGQGFPGQGFGGQGASQEDYSDFFSSMFGGAAGGGQGRSAKFKGQDFSTLLELDLKSVYKSQPQLLNVNSKKIRFTIPAGIENGQTIKITGKGGAGMNGGPNGDLYIEFSIINTTKFKRDGSNLYATQDLDLYTAILGGELTVDTFNGKIKLKIPPETQGGTKVKLKGKGFPVYKKTDQFGDLIVTYNVKMPTKLSTKEKSLFKELQNLK